MRRLKTHFEQIPVEEVKKIIEAEVAEKKQTDGDDDVIVETPPSKSEPSGVHSLHKGSLKMAASFGMEYRDDDLQYPDWQSPVQKALLELNRDKLNALVAEAEAVTSIGYRPLRKTPITPLKGRLLRTLWQAFGRLT
jgi:hypothetical protein